LLQKLSKENDPIEVQWNAEAQRYLYYGNSSLLNQLKYYPIALLLIILLFVLLIYNYYQSNKFATENKLWAGMAKETAHQIGTPLSSLMGWVEIMKGDDADAVMVSEIEKDLRRLQMITDRFSKIGSEPLLEVLDVTDCSRQTYEYLTSRFSKQVSFEFHAPEKPLYSKINGILHSWTIENLVKNAVDAMKGKGSLEVHIVEIDDWIKIYVIDTGKGIPKKEFKKIFEPGFTTKKRGWGLGLSLTKRIVEDYHKGKIAIERSEIGKGTTIVVSLRQFENLKI
jgi:two-component system, sporulation sensor kinase D